MHKKEDATQKNLDFFRDSFGRLLDNKEMANQQSIEIAGMAEKLQAQTERIKEIREQIRDWSAEMRSLKESLQNLEQNQPNFQEQLDSLKAELLSKIAESREETHQLLLEFLTKINGYLFSQVQKPARDKAFF